MLQLVLGRAGYGKTEYVFSSIKTLVDSGEKDIMLITPEQFSFISERRLLIMLGESKVNCVENTSFSRLSDEISRQYGGDSLPVLSKGAKAIMMKKAIETVSDGLVLFNKNNTSNAFINSAIRIYDEMKSCRVSCDDIIKASDSSDRELLKLKLKDISLIINAYDALIKDEYLDSASELTRLYDKLIYKNYFENRIVFIDGFSGFVAQEYKILEIIIKQAKAVYVTFCSDSSNNSDKYNLFSYINSNINILKTVAKKANSQFMNPILLDKPYRFVNDDIRILENNLFSDTTATYENIPENIKVYSAQTISDECDYIGSNISKLLRKGYRASDVAIICRDMDKYNQELQMSFKKYNVPFFDDERQRLASQPIIMFVNFLLRCVIFSYKSDDVFSLVKTGLTALEAEKINSLENYVYIWNINGSKWKSDFVQSPRGFVDKFTDDDKLLLDDINDTRAYLISRIIKFANSCKEQDCKGVCEAIYNTLLSFSADEKLRELAILLDNNGKSALAKEQGRVWDFLMNVLNELAVVGGNNNISLKDFYELFNLYISNEDMGSIPSGLDNVQVGSADRIRCDSPKIVFVCGANEGEFPQAVSSAGLLSESDRVDLINNNFKLYSYGETLIAQEKYFAYMAVCAPSEKLFVSYIGAGKANVGSSIVTGITSVYPNLIVESNACTVSLEKIESIDNAFEILASNYDLNNLFVNSLKEYFKKSSEYATRLSAVHRLNHNDSIVISDPELATKLFKKNMYLSASRIEDYYNCAFRYFCKFGVNARPRIKAEMNPMQTGTVVHYVLEKIIMQKSTEGFNTLDDAEINMLVKLYLDEFLNTKMGDSNEFTSRFKYQFMRLSRMLVYVVKRLRDEFSQSDFVPTAFELNIGNGTDNEPVRSKHINLDDGGSIEIKGAIDRVDTYNKDGKRYIRVVDYKTGDKKFQLSDILYGLNLQMFIYLFTLCEDKHYDNAVSSGVLYMHSARSVVSSKRYSTDDDIRSVENSAFKMKGIVLNDDEHEIAEHMEYDLKGKYIPVKMTKKNGLSGNIVTLEELGRISRKIDSLISEMGINLHSGCISQNPVEGKYHTSICDKCDYSVVCKNSKEILNRELEALEYNQVLEMLKEEEQNA